MTFVSKDRSLVNFKHLTQRHTNSVLAVEHNSVDFLSCLCFHSPGKYGMLWVLSSFNNPMDFVDSSYICAYFLRWIHDMYATIRDPSEVNRSGS